MVGVDKIHKWATLLGLGVKSGIDLPNEVQGLVPSTGVEARSDATRSGTPARRSRSSIGQGAGVADAGLDGGLHGDARQRRHARDAAPAQGGRRRHGLEAGAAAAAAIDGSTSMPSKLQAIRDGLWMVVNGGGTGGTRADRGPRRVGQDRHRAGHLERRAQAAGEDRPRTCATTAGSCSSRRATTRRSPASCSSSTAIHGGNRGADRAPRPRDVLREAGRAAAAAAADQISTLDDGGSDGRPPGIRAV